MSKIAAAFHLILALGLCMAVGLGYASTPDRQVRVLNQGDSWQVAFAPGEYAYQIEFLEGKMFVSVDANFLDENDVVVYSTTHTLVDKNRMRATRTFAASQVVEGVATKAVRFECGSGKARISFGLAKAING